MALTLEDLLQPVPGDDPAGEDMAYENERQELEQMFERSVSSDTSGVEAEEPEADWRHAFRLIEAESRRTKDIWLPVYLCRAAAMAGDLEKVALGAQYLAGLVEGFWADMHPKLDEYGFQGRKGPCESLAGYGQFLLPLRRTALLEHPRLGRYTGDDFVRFRQNAEAEEGYGMFRAAIEAVGEEGLRQTIGLIERIENGLKRADAVLTANADGTTAPNLKPAYDALAELKRAVAAFGATPQPEAAEASGAGGDEPGGVASSLAAPAAGGKLGGRVQSRQDVLAALDMIADYYRRVEPASPIPLMIQRMREWVNSDFLAVLRDIAPASLEEVNRVLLSREAQQNSGG